MSKYVTGGAGGFNLLRQWRKNLSTKAKEASPKASLLRFIYRNINLTPRPPSCVAPPYPLLPRSDSARKPACGQSLGAL